MRARNKPIGFILFHPINQGIGIDVFIKKGVIDEDAEKITYEGLNECPWAEKWLKRHRGYVWVGGTDFLFPPKVVAKIIEGIAKLLAKGYKIEVMEGWE